MQKNNEELKNFLHSLPYNEAVAIRKRIAEKCMIQQHTIYNWTNGGTRIAPIYMRNIELCCRRKIFT